ncbi:MAG: hypothetical protein BJ554DRAFT_4229 [Olpidium bornovanus]|uniref:Uncharacterized protein n=1 Tax=Olpidium bornovanus TaxID=278681 RepID=A0A8H8A283_9FUNG|nr:MAG: hypothetical protein BJ554DRAFT_4229 [Olpidium bornovanus]
MSISLTLAAIVLRNWHPVLLTYALFALIMAVSHFTLYTMMVPGPNLALRRAASWRSMPPALHLHFFQQFNCCGYSSALVNNSPTCNLEAIGKGSTTTTASSSLVTALAAAPSTPAPAPAGAAPAPAAAFDAVVSTPQRPASTRTGGTTAPRTATSPRIVRRQQQPAVPETAVNSTAPAPAAAPAAIPQFTTPAPLASDSKPAGPPPPPNFRPPLPDSGVGFCQKSVDPALDAELAAIRGYYIFGGLLSLAQLGLLCVYWTLLGTWKRSRGVARW